MSLIISVTQEQSAGFSLSSCLCVQYVCKRALDFIITEVCKGWECNSVLMNFSLCKRMTSVKTVDIVFENKKTLRLKTQVNC